MIHLEPHANSLSNIKLANRTKAGCKFFVQNHASFAQVSHAIAIIFSVIHHFETNANSCGIELQISFGDSVSHYDLGHIYQRLLSWYSWASPRAG